MFRSAGGLRLVHFGDAPATTTGPSGALAFNNSTAEAHGIGNFVFAGEGQHVFRNRKLQRRPGNFNGTNRVTGNFNRVYTVFGGDR